VWNTPVDVVEEEERREVDGELEVEVEIEAGRKLPAPPMEVLMYF